MTFTIDINFDKNMKAARNNTVFHKHNFVIDEVVQINHTTDPELDGQTGTILGRSIVDVLDFYIVLLDKPHSRGDKAISITEACLDRIIGN